MMDEYERPSDEIGEGETKNFAIEDRRSDRDRGESGREKDRGWRGEIERGVTHERKAEATEPLNERALPQQRMRMGDRPIEDTSDIRNAYAQG